MNRECRLLIKDKLMVKEAIIKALGTSLQDMNNTSLASSKDMAMVLEVTSRDVGMVTRPTSKGMLMDSVLAVSLLFRKRWASSHTHGQSMSSNSHLPLPGRSHILGLALIRKSPLLLLKKSLTHGLALIRKSQLLLLSKNWKKLLLLNSFTKKQADSITSKMH